jgi:hypothetical protein
VQDLYWQLEVKNPHHNHGPSLNPSGYHVHRKRTTEQKESIKTMSAAGAAPKRILTAIR